MKSLEVVAAIIESGGKILCMERGAAKYQYVAYKYEFPGGKVETGESGSQALMRELREEMDLSLKITEKNLFMTVDYRYPDFEIHLHCYLCHAGEVNFVRREHINHLWLEPGKLDSVPWAPADAAVIRRLKDEGDITARTV